MPRGRPRKTLSLELNPSTPTPELDNVEVLRKRISKLEDHIEMLESYIINKFMCDEGLHMDCCECEE
jgi:hypothetical protein